MGEEYGERRPFQFFTDHTDPEIAEATRVGRRREFERFSAFAGDEIPDPQDVRTFERSKLDRSRADGALFDLYRELLSLRRSLPRELLAEADEAGRVLRLRRGDTELVLNFSDGEELGVRPLGIALRRSDDG